MQLCREFPVSREGTHASKHAGATSYPKPAVSLTVGQRLALHNLCLAGHLHTHSTEGELLHGAEGEFTHFKGGGVVSVQGARARARPCTLCKMPNSK